MNTTLKTITFRYFEDLGFYRRFVLFLLSLLCLNVVVLSIAGSYDFRIGWVHLTAHGLFKPMLMMNGCFVFALMICGIFSRTLQEKDHGFVEKALCSDALYWTLLLLLIASLALAVYYPSASVNFSHHDWNHRHISAEVNSLHSAWQLFTKPQADGFYRPLTFLSLWVDYRLFGSHFAYYHIQSIALHIINSLLVALLAGVLGFRRIHCLWAGLLYTAAAVSFEAVLWPAARFDLLATLFTLMALIVAVKYFRDGRIWFWALPISLLLYTAGIMNKESSYSFPLLISFVVATHRIWSIPRPARRKVLLYLSLAAAITAIMVLVRIAIYGGLGGYPTPATAESPHFSIGFRTATSMIRAVPISLLGVNTASASPGWLREILVGFAVFLLVAAVAGRGCFGKKEYALLVCVLLASIPVLNLIGWIGTPLQHSRYLYMPTVFVMLLLVSTFGKVRWSGCLLGVFLVVNALGAASNIWVYRNMLTRTEILAEKVRMDWAQQPDAQKIFLVDLPENPSGVFFFAHELVERMERKIPSATILRRTGNDFSQPANTTELAYKWNDRDRTLDRIP